MEENSRPTSWLQRKDQCTASDKCDFEWLEGISGEAATSANMNGRRLCAALNRGDSLEFMGMGF